MKLKGLASHPRTVRDVYVLVRLGEGAKKAFYHSSRVVPDPKRLPFDVDVPLGLGRNIVEVVARSSERLQARRSLVIHRDK